MRFEGHGFQVASGDLWLCLGGVAEDFILSIKELEGNFSLLSKNKSSDRCLGPFRMLIFDPTEPHVVGFLATVLEALAEADVPIMAYSSYHRDYVLVPSDKVDEAISSLEKKGFRFRGEIDL